MDVQRRERRKQSSSHYRPITTVLYFFAAELERQPFLPILHSSRISPARDPGALRPTFVMPSPRAPHYPQRADRYVLPWAMRHRVRKPFLNFVRVSRPPEDLGCLLRVAENLRAALKVSPILAGLPAFAGWADLFRLLLEDSETLARELGPQVRGLTPAAPNPTGRHLNPLEGQIGRAPLFAMLCEVHKDYPSLYGALQLQILYAHWRKIQQFGVDHPGHVGPISEIARRYYEGDRDIKLADTAARTVRAFANPELADWILLLDPHCTPQQFLDRLAQNRPPESDLRVLHDRVWTYCLSGYAPGSGGIGGRRVRSIDPYLYWIEYAGRRFDLNVHGREREGDGDGTTQHHVVGRRRGRSAGRLTRKAILDLGLDPLELAAENPTVLTTAPGAANRQEAQEMARATTRSFEIDRRLYPWQAGAMRVEEFHRHIRPHLQRLARKDSASVPELAAASAVAILAETGRSLDEVMQLRVEERPISAFAYRRPQPRREPRSMEMGRHPASLYCEPPDPEGVCR